MSGKLRTELGSSLFEYIAPIGLIGVVFGIGLFTYQNDGLIQRFIESSVHGETHNNGVMEFGIESTGGVAGWGDDDTIETSGIPSTPGGGLGEPEYSPGIMF